MIEQTLSDGVLTLRLAHGKVSAMDIELLAALSAACDIDPSVRAVVITGSGRCFSAGVDLRRLLDEGQPYIERFLPALDAVFRKLFALPVPVIAAINGHAIAGGCVLAQCADYRLMAAGKGRIGVPELLVGVPFPAAAIEVLRHRLDPSRLEAVILGGRTLDPEAALDNGLVDELCPEDELAARAQALAAASAGIPAATAALNKGVLRAAALARMDAGADYNAQAMACWRDPATLAGIAEYLQRTVGR